MTLYYIIFSILLALDISVNIGLIHKYKTMSFARKTILTLFSGAILLTFLLIRFKWFGLLAAPFYIFLWAIIKDAILGLWFHKDPFYLSENVQPDKFFLKISANKYAWTAFKLVALIFFSGLLRYIPKKNGKTKTY